MKTFELFAVLIGSFLAFLIMDSLVVVVGGTYLLQSNPASLLMLKMQQSMKCGPLDRSITHSSHKVCQEGPQGLRSENQSYDLLEALGMRKHQDPVFFHFLFSISNIWPPLSLIYYVFRHVCCHLSHFPISLCPSSPSSLLCPQ